MGVDRPHHMNNAIPIVVFGQSGRISNALSNAFRDEEGIDFLGRTGARACSKRGLIEFLDTIPRDTLVCDFTHPASTRVLLGALDQKPRKVILGTSGLTTNDDLTIERLAKRMPIIQGRNFSLGAAMIKALLAHLGHMVANDHSWNAGLIDFHHEKKIDPVSATAHDWSATWQKTSGKTKPNISAVRLGDAISEHALIAAGTGERIELWHKITSLNAPIGGVLAAAKFLSRQSSGLYTPEDLL